MNSLTVLPSKGPHMGMQVDDKSSTCKKANTNVIIRLGEDLDKGEVATLFSWCC